MNLVEIAYIDCLVSPSRIRALEEAEEISREVSERTIVQQLQTCAALCAFGAVVVVAA